MKNLNAMLACTHLNGYMPNSDEKDEDPIDVRTLYAAIIARAICDGFGTSFVEHAVRREAQAWLMLWEDIDYKTEFSFPWVCEHLDLDPVLLRKTLAKPKEFVDYRFNGHYDLNGFIRRMMEDESVQILPRGKNATRH